MQVCRRIFPQVETRICKCIGGLVALRCSVKKVSSKLLQKSRKNIWLNKAAGYQPETSLIKRLRHMFSSDEIFQTRFFYETSLNGPTFAQAYRKKGQLCRFLKEIEKRCVSSSIKNYLSFSRIFCEKSKK